MAWQENGFPLVKGQVNITVGGTIKGNILCVSNGSIDVNWAEGTQTSVALVAGNAYSLKNADDATVTSGIFHYTE